MNKQEYYNIREEVGILNNISKMIDDLNDIMETYWQTKTMTLEDTKKWLYDRHASYELKLQNNLNVK